ncbi:MAG: prolyl oligopeptidase family serine peptidase [Acidobacteriota bacterium]
MTRARSGGRFGCTALAALLLSGAAGARPSLPATSAPSVTESRLEVEDVAGVAAARPLEDFLVRPRIREVSLSPDGRRVAFLLRGDDSSELGWLDPETGEPRTLLHSRLIDSVHWSGDGGGLFMETDDRLGFVDAETAEARWLYRLAPTVGEAEFLDVDRDRPRSAWVLSRSAEDRYRLLRIDALGGLETVRESDQPMRHFLTYGGTLRYLKRTDGAEQVILRLADARNGATESTEVLRCDGLDRCLPVATETSEDGVERLWLLGSGGGDLTRLYGVALPGGGDVGGGHVDPKGLADLQTLVFDPASGRPRLAVHDSDRRRHYGLDPGAARSVELLERRFPGARLRIEIGGRHWLVEEGGPRVQHPRYHLFDPIDGDSVEILADERGRRPSIPPSDLGPTDFVLATAGDGHAVPGLVTVPPGLSEEQLASAPVVLRVHGGPWSHTRARWSALTQFLASRGYIVYEPNFRASTGFGRQHVMAGAGEFGDGRVQLDMLEGLEHVHRLGLGDRDRVAILGHSFGGFSTLGGLAFTPERFVAGVASAAPIDLVRAIRDLPEDELQSNGIPRRRVLTELAGDLDDPETARDLRRRSPEAHLASTRRPLVLFAGGADPKVDIVDVRHYAGALRALDLDVSLLVDPAQGHSFEHEVSLGAYFLLVESFLARHLGGAVVGSRDSRLAGYVERHLVLEGASLGGAGIIGGESPPRNP